MTIIPGLEGSSCVLCKSIALYVTQGSKSPDKHGLSMRQGPLRGGLYIVLDWTPVHKKQVSIDIGFLKTFLAHPKILS